MTNYEATFLKNFWHLKQLVELDIPQLLDVNFQEMYTGMKDELNRAAEDDKAVITGLMNRIRYL